MKELNNIKTLTLQLLGNGIKMIESNQQNKSIIVETNFKVEKNTCEKIYDYFMKNLYLVSVENNKNTITITYKGKQAMLFQ